MPNRRPTLVDLPVVFFVNGEPCILFPVDERDPQDARDGRNWHEDCDLRDTQPLQAIEE